jgi:hypothetical protein
MALRSMKRPQSSVTMRETARGISVLCYDGDSARATVAVQTSEKR